MDLFGTTHATRRRHTPQHPRRISVPRPKALPSLTPKRQSCHPRPGRTSSTRTKRSSTPTPSPSTKCHSTAATQDQAIALEMIQAVVDAHAVTPSSSHRPRSRPNRLTRPGPRPSCHRRPHCHTSSSTRTKLSPATKPPSSNVMTKKKMLP
jgi:hypothetical protein